MLPTKRLKNFAPQDLIEFINVLKCVRENDLQHDVARLISELERLVQWYRDDLEAQHASWAERQYQIDDQTNDELEA